MSTPVSALQVSNNQRVQASSNNLETASSGQVSNAKDHADGIRAGRADRGSESISAALFGNDHAKMAGTSAIAGVLANLQAQTSSNSFKAADFVIGKSVQAEAVAA